jgi:hypothetical protein
MVCATLVLVPPLILGARPKDLEISPGGAKEPWERVKPGTKVTWERVVCCFCCCMTVRIPEELGAFRLLRRRYMNSFHVYLLLGWASCLGGWVFAWWRDSWVLARSMMSDDAGGDDESFCITVSLMTAQVIDRSVVYHLDAYSDAASSPSMETSWSDILLSTDVRQPLCGCLVAC